jgi:hypothetical protein
MLSPGLTVLQVPKANYRSNSQPLASFKFQLLTYMLTKQNKNNSRFAGAHCFIRDIPNAFLKV